MTLILSSCAVDAHSGYEFPWSPFAMSKLMMGSQMHDFHHSKNVVRLASDTTAMHPS
jgi:sterol desaturase/sphingolipid hydroxylase (fatty acid hydroxylase superfamily)